MSKLNTFVTVHQDGEPHTFGPDDEVPSWAEKSITNPNVWAEAPKSKDKSEKSGKSKDKAATTEALATGSPEGETGAPATSDDASNGEPPRAGAGSGLDAWKAFAAGQGIEVPDDAKREDIFALVDASKEQ